ncbi:MAG: hypothetical protein ABI592_06025 [Acidobacteriota bacterium]
MKSLLDLPAFAVGEETYSWQDVVLAAMVRGDWAALEVQTREGLALAHWAENAGERPSDEDLDAVAQEFRYERDLIAAEEMEVWLARFGLTVDDWMGAIERAMLRSAHPEEVGDALARFSVDESEVSRSAPADAVCSGALPRFAMALAARAAIANRSGAEPPRAFEEGRSAERTGRMSSIDAAFARLGFPPANDGRVAALARLEEGFEEFSRRLADPSAIRGQIEAHRLDWILLDWRALVFSEEAAAREAALCLREDGESLEAVAEDAHLSIVETRAYLGDVDASARPELLSARPGDFVGPLRIEDVFHVLQLRGKTMPSEEDPEVRNRAETSLRSKVTDQEVAARVRWHDPV